MHHDTPSSPFLWLLMFKCEVPVPFYCLIARTLDRVNLQAESFFGKLWGKFGFVGESKLCAMLRPAGSPLCGQSRLLLTPDTATRAFFNQLRPDRRAERMSVSMERTGVCFKANIAV